MENKNTIIALMLMMAVWFGFSLFSSKPVPPVLPDSPQVQTSPVENVNPQGGEQPVLVPSPVESSNVVGVQQNDSPVREVVVENEVYRAVFSSRGASLVSFTTKKYRQTTTPEAPSISLVDSNPTLVTSGSEGLGLASDALFQIDNTLDSLSLSGSDQRQLIFYHRRHDGLLIEKIYSFSGDQYPFQLQIKVSNTTAAPVSGQLTLGLVSPWDEKEKGDSFTFVGPVTLAGEDVQMDKPEKLAKEPRQYSNDTKWSGFENKYFITAVIPLKVPTDKVRIEQVKSFIHNVFETSVVEISPGQALQFDYLLYFGPRDLDILKQVNYDLAKAIDFGLFTPIAKPLLHILKFFYAFLGNYGVAIILLTVIIKLLFWPLTHKSYASMKDMQKLQPQMQKIREKYKSDRERQNRELMELYKTHRVNPLGGCLPMLVQIPVFFALYKVLMDAIELRQAPFALWITDLSLKDPYYVTPLIMGATMFIQQKMTPSTMDPTQAKVFMLMPIIFTFLFLNFPSGLVVYWLVNNLLTILQQYFIHKKA